MVNQARPFWEILMIAFGANRKERLSCSECTLVMDYLADQALEGLSIEELKDAAFRTFDHCLDCTDHFLQHITELEDKFQEFNKMEWAEINVESNNDDSILVGVELWVKT